jgi:hypothetical protein
MTTTYLEAPLHEFELISKFYGDRRARRSGLPLINHVVEVKDYGEPDNTVGAWCLHPMVQGDADLERTLSGGLLERANPVAVALAMEYRFRANSYLSYMPPNKEPSWGHVSAVRVMLIADKVQNRKDFEQHLADHPEVRNGERLRVYYKQWLNALKVDEDEYARLAKLLP